MRYRYANMASVHKQTGKPNWFCAYYDPEGFRRFRSTETEDKRIAKTICVTIDHASDLTRKNRLSNEKAMKMIREASAGIEETHGKLAGERAAKVLQSTLEGFVKLSGGELTAYSIKGWLTAWLNGRTDLSMDSKKRYQGAIDDVVKFLGARANKPLATLQDRQIEEFKSWLANRVALSTVNLALKVCKAAFNAAVVKRQLEFNPAKHVAFMDDQKPDDECRRKFTDDEICKLLKVASSEWRTMILLGYYTGQRLRDCSNLTWEGVDLVAKNIDLRTLKTRREQDIPIADPLAAHLQTIAGDTPNAPLCPSLAGKASSVLSCQFHALMVKAGLAEKRPHQSTGVGRAGKREKGRISFHSLRYSTTSALKNLGVSDSVAMDIIGHETKAISRNYTKIDNTTKRAAVSGLTDFVKMQPKAGK